MTKPVISDYYGVVITAKLYCNWINRPTACGMVITHTCTLPTRVGFDILLQQLNDLSLDTPNASEVLGNFIARAVADDCLPPSYVQNHQNLKEIQAMLVS